MTIIRYIENKQYQQNLKKKNVTRHGLSIKVYLQKNTDLNEKVRINASHKAASNDSHTVVYHISDI